MRTSQGVLLHVRLGFVGGCMGSCRLLMSWCYRDWCVTCSQRLLLRTPVLTKAPESTAMPSSGIRQRRPKQGALRLSWCCVANIKFRVHFRVVKWVTALVGKDEEGMASIRPKCRNRRVLSLNGVDSSPGVSALHMPRPRMTAGGAVPPSRNPARFACSALFLPPKARTSWASLLSPVP